MKPAMLARMRSTLDAVLARSPAQPLFLWRASRNLTVLAYHAVERPDRLAEHLDELRRGAAVVSLPEAVAGLRGERRLPRRAVLVTFDDGDRSVLDVGVPLLQDRGMPAVAFVVPGVLDSDRPFWWDEVRDLVAAGGSTADLKEVTPAAVLRKLKSVPDRDRRAAVAGLRRTAERPARPGTHLRSRELPVLESAGVAVGNHTWSHPILPLCSAEVAEAEIRRAHEMLTAVLGHAPTSFAYPNGDYDPRGAALLEDLGYRCAFVFDHRHSTVPADDPLRVSRVRVGSDTPLDRFRLVLSGLHPALHRALGRV